MYSITKLSGGQQILLGQKESVIKAIELAVGYANEYVKGSEHVKKLHEVFVREVGEKETMCPDGTVAEVSVWFPTVARSSQSFWIVK